MFDRKAADALVGSMYTKMTANSDIAHRTTDTEDWTLADMVGHLVESASNNHQRFMRLQLGNLESFPGYDAEPWKRALRAERFDFTFLATFWKDYNRFLFDLIEGIDGECLDNVWTTPESAFSLGFLIEDYVRHLRWHDDLFDRTLVELRSTSEIRTAIGQ